MTHVIPAGIRALVTARDKPQGVSAPLCWVCGNPIPGWVEIHHRRFLGRGGDDRTSNLICLHPQMGNNAYCHITRAHDNQHEPGEMDAKVALWQISRHARDDVYYEPVWHAALGWQLLDDDGGRRPARPDEVPPGIAGIPVLGRPGVS